MKRLPGSLALIIVLSLAACSMLRPAAERGPVVDSAGLPAPQPTATGVPPHGAPQVAVLAPLLVDSQGGRLYATGQVNGLPRLLVLDAADGRLLAAWDTLGQLALDAARNRLVVDGGRQGVSLLDATTGEVAAVVALPAQDGPPAPQIDAETGLVYAFRQATVYKGRSRDTAWYSVIDSEWPRLRAVFERWLDRDNFDASGLQRASLGNIRAALQSNRTADGRPGED